MSKLDDILQRSAQHICVFGAPKSGKSTLVGELAEHGFTLHWLSLDGGHEVLRKLGASARSKIDIIRIPDTNDWPVGRSTVKSILNNRAVTICQLHGQVNCSVCKKSDSSLWETIDTSTFGPQDILVIDPGSQVTDSAIAYIVAAEMKASKGKVGPEDIKFDYDNWRQLGSLMTDILSPIQNAPYHVIYITHPLEVEMEDGTIKLVPLTGSRNFSAISPKFFDHIVYCEVANLAHKFGSHTTYKASVLTGSRADAKIDSTKPSLLPFFAGVDLNASASNRSAQDEQKKVESTDERAVSAGDNVGRIGEQKTGTDTVSKEEKTQGQQEEKKTAILAPAAEKIVSNTVAEMKAKLAALRART